jgi:hypothetical protein
MNFRTTILLLVVLAAAAAVFFATRGKDAGTTGTVKKDDETSGEKGKRIVEVAPAGVNKLVVTPAGGERLVFERAGVSEWRLVEPVKGPAEAFRVEELVRQVTDLRSTGLVDAANRGLEQPRYVLELTDKDNKTTRINVGNRSPVGDMLYVRLEGEQKADIVSSQVLTELAKPAREFRKTRVVNVPADKVTGVTVTQADKTLRLEKGTDGKWQIIEPAKMPGDAGQVSSLISAVNGLDAVEFVDESASAAGIYGLTKPSLTVSLSTAPPTTRPTSAPATTRASGDTMVVKFGRPDVEKKNVYAIASPSGPVVTVPATSVDAFRKTPLDLRDRQVLNIDADAVSRIAIATDTPATTQPTTKPASNKQLVLERRSEMTTVGPPAPAAPATKPSTTGPTTKPSTTAPTTGPTTVATTAPAATQPAEPDTKWLLASDPKGPADDDKVEALLTALHPLRAEKFLEKFPTTQASPAATYTVKLNARSWADQPAREYELKITDPGHNAKLVGQLGDLTFELERGILTSLTADFKAPKDKPATPTFGAGQGFPQGLPPGLDLPDDLNK